MECTLKTFIMMGNHRFNQNFDHRHPLSNPAPVASTLSMSRGNYWLIQPLGIDGSDDDSSSCEHCTPWKPTSACSVSCGGGTQTLTSTCTKIVECNTQPCRRFPFSTTCFNVHSVQTEFFGLYRPEGL